VTVTISNPTKERLLRILRILEEPVNAVGDRAGRKYTSAELAELTGWPSHTIRKDISSLKHGLVPGTAGTTSGYEPGTLVPLIKETLGLNRGRKFCVVGLGRLGSAYLNLGSQGPGTIALGEFELAAGFDSNVNRVEILKSPVPLYPAYKMREVIPQLGIEIALLCVPAEAAQGTAEKLAAAGIRGILNFAPVVLTVPMDIVIRNIYIRDELLALTIKMK